MGNPAFEWIGPISPRNFQYIESDILSILERRDARRHPCKTEISVEQQIRADGVVRSIRQADDAAVAIAGLLPVFDRTARCLIEYRRRGDVEIQNAEAAEHGELVSGIPVYLGVSRIAVEYARRGSEVIVGQTIGACRQRQPVDQLPRNAALAAGRNDRVRNDAPARSIGVSGERVIERSSIRGKLPVALVGGRNGDEARYVPAARSSFMIGEEK